MDHDPTDHYPDDGCEALWHKRANDRCGGEIYTARWVMPAPGLWIKVYLCKRHSLAWDQQCDVVDAMPAYVEREPVSAVHIEREAESTQDGGE